MSTVTAKFTLDHYEHMVESGAFDGPYRKRVELINGEILEMSPIGFGHAELVDQIVDWSYSVVDLPRTRISSQRPIRIQMSDSEPEPDIVWFERRVYENHPEPKDVLLLVEVSESTLAYDRGEKLAVYAEAGIQDYWIVNLIDSQIEVYRDPVGKAYQTKAVFGRNDTGPNPLAAPGVTLTPSDLF